MRDMDSQTCHFRHILQVWQFKKCHVPEISEEDSSDSPDSSTQW